MSGQASRSGLKKNQSAAPSGRGGARPGSGRKPGKVTAPLREIARQHTEKAVRALIDILDDDDAPAAARVSAANSILDRGYGKPSQPIDGDGAGGAIIHRIELVGIAPK
jgi:hypothetical protein